MPVADMILRLSEDLFPVLTACTQWINTPADGDFSDYFISGESVVAHDTHVQRNFLNIRCLPEVKLEPLIEDECETVLLSRGLPLSYSLSLIDQVDLDVYIFNKEMYIYMLAI